MKPLVSSDYVTRIIRSLEGNQGFAYPGDQDGAILRNAYRGFSGKAGAPYQGWALQFEYNLQAEAGQRVTSPRIVPMREAVSAEA